MSFVDPVMEAKRREESDRLPFIVVQEFYVEYEPQPDGSQKPVEFVRWAKKGVQNPAVTVEKIARLQKFPENEIWQVIRPIYERWKAGQAAPVDGVPLAAWPGATPQLVKALEPANIRSVEDLARMEDSAIARLAIPNLRQKQKDARAYLDAMKSTAGVAAENAKLKEVVEHQAKELAELKALVTSMAADKGINLVDEPEKRRPGRPRKVEAA